VKMKKVLWALLAITMTVGLCCLDVGTAAAQENYEEHAEYFGVIYIDKVFMSGEAFEYLRGVGIGQVTEDLAISMDDTSFSADLSLHAVSISPLPQCPGMVKVGMCVDFTPGDLANQVSACKIVVDPWKSGSIDHKITVADRHLTEELRVVNTGQTKRHLDANGESGRILVNVHVIGTLTLDESLDVAVLTPLEEAPWWDVCPWAE